MFIVSFYQTDVLWPRVFNVQPLRELNIRYSALPFFGQPLPPVRKKSGYGNIRARLYHQMLVISLIISKNRSGLIYKTYYLHKIRHLGEALPNVNFQALIVLTMSEPFNKIRWR